MSIISPIKQILKSSNYFKNATEFTNKDLIKMQKRGNVSSFLRDDMFYEKELLWKD